jgi:hypothetical protein
LISAKSALSAGENKNNLKIYFYENKNLFSSRGLVAIGGRLRNAKNNDIQRSLSGLLQRQRRAGGIVRRSVVFE